jgi:hypothetical protein
MPKSSSGGTALATRNDIKGILSDIDPAEMLAIMSVRPTIADIEEASVWLEGDPDVFGAGEAVQGVASEIIAILTENEKEEPPRAGSLHACRFLRVAGLEQALDDLEELRFSAEELERLARTLADCTGRGHGYVRSRGPRADMCSPRALAEERKSHAQSVALRSMKAVIHA